jgi:hypothetical protein
MINVHTEIQKLAVSEIPGVVCKNTKCGAGIGIAGDLADLGKSFKAKCLRAIGDISKVRN